jgi:hypothetical protein
MHAVDVRLPPVARPVRHGHLRGVDELAITGPEVRVEPGGRHIERIGRELAGRALRRDPGRQSRAQAAVGEALDAARPAGPAGERLPALFLRPRHQSTCSVSFTGQAP